MKGARFKSKCLDKDARVILIGFTYATGRRPLIGCLVDLYRVYVFLQEQGFHDIHLITDLNKDPSSQDYRQVIIDGCVDANLLSFISLMQHQHKYLCLVDPGKLASGIKNLLTTNTSVRSIIYMTGHGEEHGFVCPGGILGWHDLQNAIFSPLTRTSRVIMILDVCHGWHFDLPYHLSRDENKLCFVGKQFFPACHFVLLVTTSHEAAATVGGSLVTQALISLLDLGCDEYITLRNKIESKLKVTETLRSMHLTVDVYTSYPTLYRLWPWFWKKPKTIMAYNEGLYITCA